MRLVLLLMCGLLIGAVVGFTTGREWGRFRALHAEAARRYEEDRKLVAPVLAADPAFRRVVTIDFPVAGICLAGPVETAADRDRLHAAVARLFGEPRVSHIMQDVVVERAAEQGAAPDRRP